MKRAQIFCIGASSMYGVGGINGGWPDLLKLDLHKTQYGTNGMGQIYEVYNLAVPGANIQDCLERSEVEISTMSKPGRNIITIIQIIGNNAIAIDRPDNFVSTEEEYRTEITEFLNMITGLSNETICLGTTPNDESKTMPINKEAEKKREVYMSNERKKLFESILAEICDDLDVTFIPLFDRAIADGWFEKYQYEDGIHPNTAGYEWTYKIVKTHLDESLKL